MREREDDAGRFTKTEWNKLNFCTEQNFKQWWHSTFNENWLLFFSARTLTNTIKMWWKMFILWCWICRKCNWRMGDIMTYLSILHYNECTVEGKDYANFSCPSLILFFLINTPLTCFFLVKMKIIRGFIIIKLECCSFSGWKKIIFKLIFYN